VSVFCFSCVFLSQAPAAAAPSNQSFDVFASAPAPNRTANTINSMGGMGMAGMGPMSGMGAMGGMGMGGMPMMNPMMGGMQMMNPMMGGGRAPNANMYAAAAGPAAAAAVDPLADLMGGAARVPSRPRPAAVVQARDDFADFQSAGAVRTRRCVFSPSHSALPRTACLDL
jgi:hypothetical protein